MVLGRALVDPEGQGHAMAGLLPLETSFAAPGLTLGYREAVLLGETPLGPAGIRYRGHEFHYASVLGKEPGPGLFESCNASGESLGTVGLQKGRVCGSFLHLIDRAAAAGTPSGAAP